MKVGEGLADAPTTTIGCIKNGKPINRRHVGTKWTGKIKALSYVRQWCPVQRYFVAGIAFESWEGGDMSLGDILGIIGLIVTFVGFGLTIWQLTRTANAAEASTEALQSATRRMNLNHLLVLLPQLRMMESDLDSATADDDAKLAIRTLVSYSHAASQVASLLEGAADEQDAELIEKLRESARSASAAKSVLVTGTSKPLRQVVKVASQQINDMSAHAAGLVTQFQSKVG